MELRFPEKSGFLIQNVAGLGASKANINSTELATMDGSIFNSSKVNSRNIVLDIKLLSVPNIETVRQKTYKYFPIKKRIKLTFELDNRICFIYGYVESNEPNIFSNSESTQISIICPDPYFYSTGIQTTVFSGIEPMFEFPFSNESLVDNLLETGDIIMNQIQTVNYRGDSEIGIMIYIHSLGDVENLLIYNVETSETMKIDTDKILEITGSKIINGDDIIISTIKNNKFIYLIRNGVIINILNCLDKDTKWFQLVKGDNMFGFNADVGNDKLQFRIENNIIYEGV
jgi:hypothetical protein